MSSSLSSARNEDMSTSSRGAQGTDDTLPAIGLGVAIVAGLAAVAIQSPAETHEASRSKLIRD